MARSVCVSFGSLKSPTRLKLITLPSDSERCDLIELREILHREMLIDMSVLDLGGTKDTRVEDVLLSQYDDRFGQAFDMTSTTVLLNGARDIVVKLRLIAEIVYVESEQSAQDINMSPKGTHTGMVAQFLILLH